ncbi:MAG TPA: FG-GAP-like repeat-containing protein, partial [Pyrinomonadaceae bacterium]|nr:FG-GAP-like repeat-containing protein [Pyrinomonadaceae bacterium]
SILTGAGDGTFSAPADFPAGKFPQYLVVADFNGDGKPDVAVDNPEAQEIRVLPGNGNGTLGAAVVTPASAAGFSNVFALAAGDFNGDGKTDLVGTRVKNGEFSDDPDVLSVFVGSGTGGFTAGQTYPVGLGPSFVAVGRVNSDALDDLVVVNRTSGSFSVLLGAGGGNFSAGLSVKTGGIPESAVIADFNGDGRADLAVPRQNSLPASDVAAYLGDGAGGFTASGNFALGGTVPFGALTADFNKDGKPDLATSNFTSANASVLLNACGGPPPQSVFQFDASTYALSEDVFGVTVRVVRTGLLNVAASVDYATSDGTASERSDYTTALGTLSFAPGESFKDFTVFVSEDSLTEGTEGFNVTLSNPTAGASLGARSAAAVQISDDPPEPSRNAIDDAETFVGQHYHDFLNRQADVDGRLFWTNEITQCGVDAACIDLKRTNVSQAFFLSIEFQRTGYQVIRVYKASFADTPQHPRGLPRYREFLRDTQELQRGVVVGQGNWEQRLRQNTLAFARRWVAGAEFAAQFPQGMTAQEFVDKLFANAGATPTAAERDAAVAAFGAGDAAGRADALLSVTDSGSVFNRQFNPAAVLMQYFGYLRRNPSDAPERTLDFAGFDFWL